MLADVSGIAVPVAMTLLVGAAAHDLATRTVPNCVPAGIALAGLSVRFAAGDLRFGAIAALAVFVGATLLWLRGLMGGADVKLLAAASLVVAPVAVPDLLLLTALSGGVLAVFYLVMSRLVAPPAPGRRQTLVSRLAKAERRRLSRRGPLPYAAAIAGGGVLTMSPLLGSWQ